MNLFFSESEVDAAVASLPKDGEAVPAKLTDGGSDKGTGAAKEPDFDLFAYVAPGEAPPGFI
jgi:hypothetical protein